MMMMMGECVTYSPWRYTSFLASLSRFPRRILPLGTAHEGRCTTFLLHWQRCREGSSLHVLLLLLLLLDDDGIPLDNHLLDNTLPLRRDTQKACAYHHPLDNPVTK